MIHYEVSFITQRFPNTLLLTCPFYAGSEVVNVGVLVVLSGPTLTSSQSHEGSTVELKCLSDLYRRTANEDPESSHTV